MQSLQQNSYLNFSEIVKICTLPVFIKAVVFHHFDLPWMILTKEKYTFSVEEHFIEWCTGVPCFVFFQNIHGPIFKELIVTSRQDIYDLIYGLHAYNKENNKLTDATYLIVEDPY